MSLLADAHMLATDVFHGWWGLSWEAWYCLRGGGRGEMKCAMLLVVVSRRGLLSLGWDDGCAIEFT
eukprot:scaffold28784_cov53-Attheya_sp.AAC.2